MVIVPFIHIPFKIKEFPGCCLQTFWICIGFITKACMGGFVSHTKLWVLRSRLYTQVKVTDVHDCITWSKSLPPTVFNLCLSFNSNMHRRILNVENHLAAHQVKKMCYICIPSVSLGPQVKTSICHCL